MLFFFRACHAVKLICSISFFLFIGALHWEWDSSVPKTAVLTKFSTVCTNNILSAFIKHWLQASNRSIMKIFLPYNCHRASSSITQKSLPSVAKTNFFIICYTVSAFNASFKRVHFCAILPCCSLWWYPSSVFNKLSNCHPSDNDVGRKAMSYGLQ